MIKIGARVIARDSEKWFQVFRINKGSADGVAVDMNVVADGGLVGIVTDVGANYATVRSIIDDSSRVGAMKLDSSYNCIVAGDLTLYEEGVLSLRIFQRMRFSGTAIRSSPPTSAPSSFRASWLDMLRMCPLTRTT